MIDYYEILEVSPKASVKVIQNAYRTLAKKWHPDGKSPDFIALSERKMKLLNEAKEVLLNDISREQYDRKLQIEKENEASFDEEKNANESAEAQAKV